MTSGRACKADLGPDSTRQRPFPACEQQHTPPPRNPAIRPRGAPDHIMSRLSSTLHPPLTPMGETHPPTQPPAGSRGGKDGVGGERQERTSGAPGFVARRPLAFPAPSDHLILGAADTAPLSGTAALRPHRPDFFLAFANSPRTSREFRVVSKFAVCSALFSDASGNRGTCSTRIRRRLGSSL